MKLTFALLTLLILNTSANTLSQTVSFEFKNATLKEVFATIKKQTGYAFLYEDDVLLKSKPFTGLINDASFNDALKMVFKDQPLTFRVFANKSVVVKAAKVKAPAAGGSIIPIIDELTAPEPIKGVIIDSLGNPLEGATIHVKGSKTNVSSNMRGEFSLNANVGDVIVISFIGFESREIKLNSTDPLRIVMQAANNKMSDVVVVSTGYQKLPLERATGSFTHITAAQLEKSNSFNLKDRLEGMVPGMFFETQYDEDQAPTSERNKSIVIRGMGTFGDVNPLIVVDGAPFYTGTIDPWTLINPSDVESITVLKDAAAASIWGSQAANGVIVITTKSGGIKKGQPLMSVSMDYLIQPVPNLSGIPWASSKKAIDIYKWMILDKNYHDQLLDPAVAARYELPEVMRVLLDMKRGTMSEAEGQARLDELAKIDVRDEFKRLFFNRFESNRKFNLSLQSGSEVNKVRTSITGIMNDMYAKGNSEYQVIANIVDEYTPKPWLKFSFGSNVFVSQRKDNGVLVNELANIPQMSRILDDDGNYLPMTMNSGLDTYYDVPTQRRRDTAAKYNLPYDWDWNLKREVDNLDKTTKTSNIRLYTNIQIKPFKDLTAELYYQYQKDHILRSEYYNEQTWYVRNMVNNNARPDGTYPVPPGGMLYENQANGNSHNARLVLNYLKKFGDHTISVLGGAEIRENTFDRVHYGYYGYDPQSLTNVTAIDFYNTITPKMTGDPADFGQTTIPGVPTLPYGVTLTGANDRYVSTYGNMGYTFKNRYDITGSIRLDQTNLYGQSASHRNLPQWSAGFGWLISDESFFTVDAIDRLKFRASYGFNGNIRKGVSPYLLGYPWVDPITRLPYAAVQSAPNPSLTWEKTGTYNLGLDFSVLKNRIYGSVEVYSKIASDVLAQIAVNGTYGYQNNRAELNTGNIKNNGIEINLNARVIDNGAFRWNTRFNYGSNRNRAYNITQVNKTAIAYTTLSFYYHLPNQPVDFIAAAEWLGYDENGQIKFMYQGKEHTVTDFPNSSVIEYGDLFKVVGQRNPKHFGQWANTFSYKNFELNISLLYKLGHKFVGDYPPSGLKTNYFVPSRFYTWMPELMANQWTSADDKDAAMYSYSEPFTGTAAETNSYQTLLNFVSRYNTKNVMNAGNIRLQSLALGYNLPEKVSGPFKNVKILIEARNIGPIWVANEQGVDPEFPAYGASQYGALQYVTRNRGQYSASIRFGF